MINGKRFTLRYNEDLTDSEYDNVIQDNLNPLTISEVCDLLNALHEENMQLKAFKMTGEWVVIQRWEQDTDDEGREIAPAVPIDEYHVTNYHIVFVFNNENEANKLCDLLNSLDEEVRLLTERLEFLEAHNKALMHTNKDLHEELRRYSEILNNEYFNE